MKNLLIDKTAKIVINDVTTSFEKFDFWVDERLPKNFISKNKALKIIEEKHDIEFDEFYWVTKAYKGKTISITIEWTLPTRPDLCVLLGTEKHDVYYLELVSYGGEKNGRNDNSTRNGELNKTYR